MRRVTALGKDYVELDNGRFEYVKRDDSICVYSYKDGMHTMTRFSMEDAAFFMGWVGQYIDMGGAR